MGKNQDKQRNSNNSDNDNTKESSENGLKSKDKNKARKKSYKLRRIIFSSIYLFTLLLWIISNIFNASKMKDNTTIEYTPIHL